MADLQYEVSFKGVASAVVRAAFGECEADTGTGITTLRCPKEDLGTVMTRIEDLGLELLEVRLVALGTSDGWS